MTHYTSPDAHGTIPGLQTAIIELAGIADDLETRINGRQRRLAAPDRSMADDRYKGEIDAYKDAKYMIDLRIKTLQAHLEHRKEAQ